MSTATADSTPEALEVHLTCDSYATHKHPLMRAWLARRPRFHIHFTPTYSSWLNQVERWFALINVGLDIAQERKKLPMPMTLLALGQDRPVGDVQRCVLAPQEM